jgi:hypothetical protein
VAGCCECGDEPSGSCATELVSGFLLEFRDILYPTYEPFGILDRMFNSGTVPANPVRLASLVVGQCLS